MEGPRARFQWWIEPDRDHEAQRLLKGVRRHCMHLRRWDMEAALEEGRAMGTDLSAR